MKAAKKIKVVTIFGTRPEIIRLSRILPHMDQYFDHKTVYTQQSFDYEMSDIFFKELQLRKPDYLLNVRSDTLGGQLANIFSGSEPVFLKEKPDAVFVLGDTNSILSVILAKRFKIPIFHMEAGTRCFDWDHPEEINRVMIDRIADFNLCYSEHNRRNLLQEGYPINQIFVTGTPMREVLEYYADRIERSMIMDQLKLTRDNYFVVSVHREESMTNEKKLHDLFDAFEFIAQRYKIPLVVTFHPRTRRSLAKRKLHTLIQLHKPFGFFDYVKLQKNARLVLSDSGTLEEEAAILGFPAVFVRETTQRPEVYDTGSMVMGGVEPDALMNAVGFVLSQSEHGRGVAAPMDYQDTNVSGKVVRIIMSRAKNGRG